MRRIVPIKNRVLVQQDPAEPRVGKERVLFAPPGREAWPAIGTVVARGPGVEDLEIQPGVRVLFERKPSSAMNPDTREGDPHEERDLVMLPVTHILAIVEA